MNYFNILVILMSHLYDIADFLWNLPNLSIIVGWLMAAEAAARENE